MIAFLFSFFFIVACGGGEKEIVLSGRTMGTTYQVKAYGRPGTSTAALSEKIDHRLEQLNDVFSTYRPGSEISRFNRFDRVGRPFPVSEDFVRVMEAAARIHRLTNGAWDGTVDPLVRLWGFHDKDGRQPAPSEEEVRILRRRVGFGFIEVRADGHLVKRRADVALDLSSIAKGYAVDQIAELLASEGLDRHLVEIGGEVVAGGTKPDGSAWKVGINRPDPDAPVDSIYRVVALADRTLATSGDYRSFFVRNGKVFSHVIDPRTGMPVDAGVVSASVLAPRCVFADGLATALMVMRPQQGLRLVAQLENVECMLVVRDADGRFADHTTPGFPPP